MVVPAAGLSPDLRRMGQTPPEEEPHMTFQAFEVALEIVRSLEQPLAILERRDPDLARQLR
jgi:hypothetical protein